MRACGKALASIGISILACGCVSSPQSRRTGQGQDYSRYVFALYDQPSGGATSRLRPSVSMNIAIAEVGQLHPDPQLLREIAAEGRIFRRVQSMTGIADGDYAADPYRSDPGASSGACPAGAAAPRIALARLQRLARDTGSDYLLLIGATIDSQGHATPLSALDLTIVGAFVAASQQVNGQADASAALIDLRADRVVLVSGASARDSTLTPAVAQQGTQDQQVRSLRDTVYRRLGKQFVEDCRGAAGLTPSSSNSSERR